MIDYKLAKKLEEAGCPQGEGIYINNPKGGMGGYLQPALSGLIKAVLEICGNEFAMGWSDSGCFWHFQYGGRGAGSMIEGFGETYSADDEDDLDSAVAKLWLKLRLELNKKT